MKPIIALLILSASLAFAQAKPECKKPPKPTPPPTPVATTNSNVNTNANTASSASNSSSNAASSANSDQSQSATGGNSAVTNNTKVAASAIAPPVLPTVPCFKGAGGAVQVGMVGGAFGGGKVDQGCDDRELARAFSGPQTIASCKILINTKKAKKAHITMEDCLDAQPVPAQVNSAVPVQVNPAVPVQVNPAPVSREVQTIVVPVTVQPVVTVLAPPEYKTSIDVYPPKPVVKKKSAVKQPPAGCHYEPAKVVTRKLVCE